MTHDELLANIDKYLIPTMAQEPNFNGAIGILKALRAVVDLHKPIEIVLPSGIKAQDCLMCDGKNYPCETIDTIEKELG